VCGRCRCHLLPLQYREAPRHSAAGPNSARLCVCTHRNGAGQTRSLRRMTAGAMHARSRFTSAPQCGECGLRQGNIRGSVQAPSYGHARSAPIRLHQLPRTQPGEPLTAPPHWGLGRVRKASVPLASASRLRATVRQGQTVRDYVVVQVCTRRNGTGQMRSLCQMTASAMQMYSSFTSAPNAASAG